MIRRAGLDFAIGLDGMSIDDDEDMLRELRLFRLLHGVDGTVSVLSPAEMFDAACRVGRHTITGNDGGGRIVPGAPADVLALDVGEMSRDFVRNDFDVSTLVLARAARRHVVRVIIGGRDIVRDGRCVTVDLPALENQLNAAARAVLATADVDPARIERLQHGITDFFACGCHRQGASGSTSDVGP